MISEIQIRKIAEEFLEGTNYFIVEIQIRSGNRISVYIDGDQRVSVDACINLNRFIETKLDRDAEDYDLTVSSCGADRPLKFPRQYLKNINNQLEIITLDGTSFTGTLRRAGETDFDLEVLPSSGRKKAKESDLQIITFQYTNIKTGKEVITFKK